MENIQNAGVEAPKKKKNGLGLAGMIVAIVGLLLCWVPILNWIILTPAFILSFIGIFKKPRVLAIVGLVISCVGFSFYSILAAILGW